MNSKENIDVSRLSTKELQELNKTIQVRLDAITEGGINRESYFNFSL